MILHRNRRMVHDGPNYLEGMSLPSVRPSLQEWNSPVEEALFGCDVDALVLEPCDKCRTGPVHERHRIPPPPPPPPPAPRRANADDPRWLPLPLPLDSEPIDAELERRLQLMFADDPERW